MTWIKFKAAVDKALADNELSQDIELIYIDLGDPELFANFEINIRESNTLGIEGSYLQYSQILFSC